VLYAGYRWLRPAPPQRARAPRPPSEALMSPAQACAVLGIDSNPSKEVVIEAHRKLMQRLHPDKGGSAHLAQQLNEAKRVLLSAR